MTIQNVKISSNASPGNRFYFYIFSGGRDNRVFKKVFVNGNDPEGSSEGHSDYATNRTCSAEVKNRLKVALLARTVINVMIDKNDSNAHG